MNTSLAGCSFNALSGTLRKMLMILGLLAVLLAPLLSLTEGKKVKGLCFLRDEVLNMSHKSNN